MNNVIYYKQNVSEEEVLFSRKS